jgi:hypothetical protein
VAWLGLHAATTKQHGFIRVILAAERAKMRVRRRPRPDPRGPRHGLGSGRIAVHTAADPTALVTPWRQLPKIAA